MAKITEFKVGDIFISKKGSTVLIVENGYCNPFKTKQKYNIVGANYSLSHFSTFGENGGKSEEILNFLNKNDYIFAENITDKIAKTFQRINENKEKYFKKEESLEYQKNLEKSGILIPFGYKLLEDNEPVLDGYKFIYENTAEMHKNAEYWESFCGHSNSTFKEIKSFFPHIKFAIKKTEF